MSSFSIQRFRRPAVAAFAATLLVACVDTPQEPSSLADSPLASTFDALSREANANGDAARGNEFAWAAIALAAGMTPSQLVVANNGRREVYEAFVHATTISAAGVNDGLTTRSLIAWRKPANVLQVIMMSAPDNTNNVLHPASAGPISQTGAPFRGAHAAYYERSDNSTTHTWIGVSGGVKLTDIGLGTQSCESALPVSSGVACARARFLTAFDVRLARLAPGARTPDAATERSLRAAEQPINGLKLSVRCVTPSLESRGCPGTSSRSR
jgi:hypothetical protein